LAFSLLSFTIGVSGYHQLTINLCIKYYPQSDF